VSEADPTYATDAVEVLNHIMERGDEPYFVPCQACTWDEGDGQFSRAVIEGVRAVCPVCGGSGWDSRVGRKGSPWVIDSFTKVLLQINAIWRG
jgi:hypothetical protein